MTDQSVSSNAIDESDEISLLDIGVVIAENLKLLIFVPLIVGLCALGVSFGIKPTFTARMSMLPPQGQQSGLAAAALGQLGALAGIAGGGTRGPAEQYLALLKSNTVADRIIDRFKLLELYAVRYSQDARMTLAVNTRATVGKEGVIVVEVDDKDPQRAADIANAYLNELQRISGGLALTEAQRRRVFFEAQLEQTKNKLADAEQTLGGIGVGLNTLKTDPRSAVEPVARLQAQVTAQEVRLASMKGFLAETAPEYRQARVALAALQNQLAKTEAGSSLPGDNSYIQKYRNFKYQETLYELYARQFELARADEAREGALIQVIDVATRPEKKSKPQRAIIAIIATLATGMLMLLFIFLRRALVTANSNPEGAGKLSYIQSRFRGLLPWASR